MARKKGSRAKSCAMWNCSNKRMPGSDLCHNHFTIKDQLHSYYYHKKEQEIHKKGRARRGAAKK